MTRRTLALAAAGLTGLLVMACAGTETSGGASGGGPSTTTSTATTSTNSTTAIGGGAGTGGAAGSGAAVGGFGGIAGGGTGGGGGGTGGGGGSAGAGAAAPSCGNGVIEGSEECDDYNTAPNDGCSASCQVEQGWTCDNSTPPSVCTPVCGDGLVKGSETCDDRNTDACGTCNANCSAAQSGHDCPVGVGCETNADCASGLCDTVTTHACLAVCGDGVIEGAETCDDYNNHACGTCNASCTGAGTGATCAVGVGCGTNGDCHSGSCNMSTHRCHAVCGDGVIEGAETCDDYNNLACGTCNANCTGAGPGATCAEGVGCGTNGDCLSGSCNVSTHQCQAVCGNGILDAGESCDDYNNLACGACNANCTGAGTGATCAEGVGCGNNGDCLSGSCNVSTHQCQAVCGNGILDAGETCDDYNSLACGACNASCTGAGTGATCAVGVGCGNNGDCLSGSCNMSTHQCQ